MNKLLRSAATRLIRPLRHALLPQDLKRIDEISAVDKGTQILLALKYRELLRQGGPMPTFRDVEFRAFSQNKEDGILHYIFTVIGTTNKRAIEMCAGAGTQCNTANLFVHHGWDALLFDGDEELVKEGVQFYSILVDTAFWPPAFRHSWITAENVNSLIRDAGFEGEIDLFSLDMDGMDYWVWKALTCISPRVVVVEYHQILGHERSITVPYKDDFRAEFEGISPNYHGASLPAFVKLAREKGYRLVGCENCCFNAFFIRNGIAEDIIPEIPASECFFHPAVRHNTQTRLPTVINREWVEV